MLQSVKLKLTNCLIPSIYPSLPPALTVSSPLHSLPHSLPQSMPQSMPHSLTPASVTHSIIHCVTHSTTKLLSNSLTCYVHQDRYPDPPISPHSAWATWLRRHPTRDVVAHPLACLWTHVCGEEQPPCCETVAVPHESWHGFLWGSRSVVCIRTRKGWVMGSVHALIRSVKGTVCSSVTTIVIVTDAHYGQCHGSWGECCVYVIRWLGGIIVARGK